MTKDHLDHHRKIIKYTIHIGFDFINGGKFSSYKFVHEIPFEHRQLVIKKFCSIIHDIDHRMVQDCH